METDLNRTSGLLVEKHQWLNKLHQVDCWFTDHQTAQHRVRFISLSAAVGASVLKVTVGFFCCFISFCEKLGDHHPPSTPTVPGRIGVKRRRRPLWGRVTPSEKSAMLHITTQGEDEKIWVQSKQALKAFVWFIRWVVYIQETSYANIPSIFSKAAVSGRNHSGWLWEKYKMKNFATAVCDAYQSEAKVSMKLLPLLPWNRRRKVTAERRHGLLLSLLFYVKAPGHSSTRPHQNLQPPCLHILLGDTERKIQSSTDCCFTFPPLFKYHWRHGWNKTYWGSQIGEGKKDAALYTWPCCLNYLPLAAALKGATSVLYVPESWTATSQGCFSPLVFNALLVRPLIPPLVSLFHNTR